MHQDDEQDDAHLSPGESSALIYSAEELFAGHQEVWIEHEGEMYRLRLTKRGKLVLTK